MTQNAPKQLNNQLQDILLHFTPISTNTERVIRMVHSAIKGMLEPQNGTHISELGDLSSMHTCRWIQLKMSDTEEGKAVLKDMPRVTEQSVNFASLKNFPHNTLGYHYYRYMSSNKFTPNERPVSRYIPQLDLAYVCQRYKETHDFTHAILGYGKSIPEEIAVKWFEAIQLRLPSSALAGIFGGLLCSFRENLHIIANYLPHVIENANRGKFILGYYYEKRLSQDIDELRKEMNLTPINII